MGNCFPRVPCKNEVIYVPKLDVPFFHTNNIETDSFLLDPGISHFNSYFGRVKNANLRFWVQESTLDFCDCYKKNDTLFILPSLPMAAYYDESKIKVFDGCFDVEYRFGYPAEGVDTAYLQKGNIQLYPFSDSLRGDLDLSFSSNRGKKMALKGQFFCKINGSK